MGCTPGGKARIRDSARGARGGVRVLHRRSICLCGFAGVPPRGGRGGVEMERGLLSKRRHAGQKAGLVRDTDRGGTGSSIP